MTSIIRRIRMVHKIPAVKEILQELRGEEHWVAQSLADALDAFFSHTVSPEEESYNLKIKSLRKELEASQEKITVVDYGAASPRLSPARSTSNEGIEVTRTVGQTCKGASISPMWGLLLFQLIKAFRPSQSLELGASLGMSTAYQAAALELNGTGRIVSLEGAESLANLARRNLARLELQRAAVKTGPFKITLVDALQELKQIDYAFIDGHHEEQATVKYFEQILPFAGEPAVFVFDDISWSDGMRGAWNAVSGSLRVRIAVDLSKLGICVVTRSLERKQLFQCAPTLWQKVLARAQVAVGAM